jgi:DNA-binding NarL/FixJ family response regulator
MSEEILVGVVAEPRPRSRVAGALARDGIRAVIEAGSIDELVRACADRRPHVAVLVGGPDPGPELRRLTRSLPRSRVVAVVPASDRDAVRGAVLAGADGVVVAADLPATLPVTVRAVWAGQTAVPSVARAVLETADLSQREREVLDLVAAGLSNAQIADRLCVTEHTVKSHLGAVFTKLGVHSRSEAIAAHAQGHGRFGSSSPHRARGAQATETRYETPVHRRQ